MRLFQSKQTRRSSYPHYEVAPARTDKTFELGSEDPDTKDSFASGRRVESDVVRRTLTAIVIMSYRN